MSVDAKRMTHESLIGAGTGKTPTGRKESRKIIRDTS